MIEIDIETRSTKNVVTAGLYAHAPTAAVLLMWYSIDSGPWIEWRGFFADGETCDCSDDPPQDLIDAINAGKLIYAFNAAYERVVLSAQPWCPVIPIEQTVCLAAWGRAFNLPASLAMVSRRLLPAAEAKLVDLTRTIKYMWEARYPMTDPSHMDIQSEYCLRDCTSQRSIMALLPPVDGKWLAEYHAAEHVNDRGVFFDEDLAGAVAELKPAIDAALMSEIHAIAGDEIKLRGPSLLNWLEVHLPEELLIHLVILEKKRDGYSFKSKKRLSANKVARKQLMLALDEYDNLGHVRRLLMAFDEANRAAMSKFTAAIQRGTDGLLQGQFMFCGAGQTKRFSSTGVQVHNLKRDVAGDVEGVIGVLIKHRSDPQEIYAKLRMTAAEAASEVLRPMFVAEDGKILIWSDWSSIEARMLPWLSGDPRADPLLQLFHDGGDIYITQAARIYRQVEVSITKTQRQVGKVACLAGDTRILVKDALDCITMIPICNVTVSHMVWDGLEWVQHDGLAANGVQPCVTLSGMKLTPDHLIWCGAKTGWMEAGRVASNERSHCLALETAKGSLSSLDTSDPLVVGWARWLRNATVDALNTGLPWVTGVGPERLDATPAPRNMPPAPVKRNTFTTLVCALILNTAAGCSTAYRLLAHAAIRQPVASGCPMGVEVSNAGGVLNTAMSVLVKPLGPVGFAPCGGGMTCLPIWSRWMGGIYQIMSWTASTMIKAMSRVTCVSSARQKTRATSATLTSCRSGSSSLRQSLPVYDLVNAGPRSRFTVITDDGPMIVHNCLALGYQGGVGAFQAMAKGYGVEVEDAEANTIKNSWRAANPWAVDFWAKLESAATDAICTPGEMFKAGRVTYQYVPTLLRGTLLCWLPSGTWLAYPEARIKDIVKFEGSEPEPAIVYMHATFGPSSTYGGALAENITQAESASLLRQAIVTCEAEDLPVVLHIHDEIVCEVPEAEAEDAKLDLMDIMTEVPAWAEGLPLACDAEMGVRYKVPIDKLP